MAPDRLCRPQHASAIRNHGGRLERGPEGFDERCGVLVFAIQLPGKGVQGSSGVVRGDKAGQCGRDEPRRLGHQRGIPLAADDRVAVTVQLPRRIQDARQIGLRVRGEEGPEAAGLFATSFEGHGPGHGHGLASMDVRGVRDGSRLGDADFTRSDAPARDGVAIVQDVLGTLDGQADLTRLLLAVIEGQRGGDRKEQQELARKRPDLLPDVLQQTLRPDFDANDGFSPRQLSAKWICHALVRRQGPSESQTGRFCDLKLLPELRSATLWVEANRS